MGGNPALNCTHSSLLLVGLTHFCLPRFMRTTPVLNGPVRKGLRTDNQ